MYKKINVYIQREHIVVVDKNGKKLFKVSNSLHNAIGINQLIKNGNKKEESRF